MKKLNLSLIVALGLVFLSSCTPKYGCPYGVLNQEEIIPAPVENVIPVERTTASEPTVAIAR